jgi:hypothetical protein
MQSIKIKINVNSNDNLRNKNEKSSRKPLSPKSSENVRQRVSDVQNLNHVQSPMYTVIKNAMANRELFNYTTNSFIIP